jgi:hypothetical protein
MPKIVVVLMGFLFVAFGRWLYANPQRLSPAYLPGANSTAMADLAKFLGIAAVFAGGSALIFSLLGVFIDGFIELIIALPACFVFTWFCFRSQRGQR